MNNSNAEELLRRYAGDVNVQELNRHFNERSTMSIYGIERKEDYHTNFLEWLFTNEELCNLTIKYLLLLLLERQSKQTKAAFPDGIKSSLLTNDFVVNHVRSLPKKAGDGVVDLLLKIHYNDNKLLYIIIENKVDSVEHNVGSTGKKQTTYYYEHYSKDLQNEQIYVYLNVTTSCLELETNQEAVCDCKYYIHINYQDILTSILEKAVNDDSIQPRKRFIIEDYISSLSKINKNKIIMAIDKTSKELLKKFWTNNSELILLALKALADDGDVDAIEAYKRATKVKPKYTVIIGGIQHNDLSARDVADIVAGELAKMYSSTDMINKFGKLDNKGHVNGTDEFDLGKTERVFITNSNKRVLGNSYSANDGKSVRCNSEWTFDKIKSLQKKLLDNGINCISIQNM